MTNATKVEPSNELRGLYAELTAGLLQCEAVLVGLKDKATQASSLLATEGQNAGTSDMVSDEADAFWRAFRLRAGETEMLQELESVCIALRKFVPGCELP